MIFPASGGKNKEEFTTDSIALPGVLIDKQIEGAYILLGDRDFSWFRRRSKADASKINGLIFETISVVATTFDDDTLTLLVCNLPFFTWKSPSRLRSRRPNGVVEVTSIRSIKRPKANQIIISSCQIHTEMIKYSEKSCYSLLRIELFFAIFIPLWLIFKPQR